MPQGRIILKSISESKKIATLKTDGARLLYTWLITHLDVNGSFSGDPDVVNGKVFTRLKKSRETVESYLVDLESVGLIIRFNANGDIFLHVPDFTDKQPCLRADREGKTTIPVPTPDQLQMNSRTSKVKESKVKESKVKEKMFKTETSGNFHEETKSHSSTSTGRIVSAWQKLPLPPDKKAVDASCLLAIDRILSELSADTQEPIHEGMILEAIENYGKALKLQHSQTFKHKIYPFLQRHVKKYVSYNFDIDHHDGSKFKKAGETESAYQQVEELKRRGDL